VFRAIDRFGRVWGDGLMIGSGLSHANEANEMMAPGLAIFRDPAESTCLVPAGMFCVNDRSSRVNPMIIAHNVVTTAFELGDFRIKRNLGIVRGIHGSIPFDLRYFRPDLYTELSARIFVRLPTSAKRVAKKHQTSRCGTPRKRVQMTSSECATTLMK